MEKMHDIEQWLEQATRRDLERFPKAPVVPSPRLLALLSAALPTVALPSVTPHTGHSISFFKFKLLAAVALVGAGVTYSILQLTAPAIKPKVTSAKPVRTSPGPDAVQSGSVGDSTSPRSHKTLSIKAEVREPGTWSKVSSDGFHPRCWFASSEVQGKIYAIGGADGFGLDSTVQVYDTKTDTWSTLQTSGKFTPRVALTSCVVNGKIYAMGGSRGPETPQNLSNALEVFDPATNEWTAPTTTGTFTPRCVLSSAELNGKIYVVGGFDCRQDLPILEVFDPTTNAWTTPKTTGHFDPRGAFQAVVLNGKLYVVGGMKNGAAPTTIQCFDPESNSWDSVRAMGKFTPRCDHACGVIDGKIYVMGGSTDGRTPLAKNSFQAFDPVKRTWNVPKYKGTFTSRVYVSSVVVDDRFYVLGGVDSTGNIVSTNEVFEFPPRGPKS